MKFLCLICAEKVMEQMPEADAEKHYQDYAEFTEAMEKYGQKFRLMNAPTAFPTP